MYKPFRNESRENYFCETFYKVTPADCKTYLYSDTVEPESTDIYVITFNNIFCAKYQIITLRKFFKSKFNIIIVDNNNDIHPDVSEELYNLCVTENVTYIKAPNNLYQTPGNFDPTMKLGNTMNWLYLHCVSKRKPKYFGYLDQDCFLFKDLNLTDYLDRLGMYGVVSRNKREPAAWNLHVTSNFFKFDFVKDILLDFRPSWELSLDTGGSNYYLLYKDYNPDDYEIPQDGYYYTDEQLESLGTFPYFVIQDNCWFHSTSSSHDKLAATGGYKLAYTKGFLDAKLGRIDKVF
jgi:5-bromo-4-chloroindolyl phosphate hydrolysis protein